MCQVSIFLQRDQYTPVIIPELQVKLFCDDFIATRLIYVYFIYARIAKIFFKKPYIFMSVNWYIILDIL